MKLNWGSGIAIFLTLFIGFILTLVVKAHQTESDLYAEDYYEQEVNYQQTIDAKARGELYHENFKVIKVESGDIHIIFPEWMNKKTAAQAMFYRADDASLDRLFSFTSKGSLMVLKQKHFVKGHYDVKISWIDDGKEFQVEKSIQF